MVLSQICEIAINAEQFDMYRYRIRWLLFWKAFAFFSSKTVQNNIPHELQQYGSVQSESRG